MASEYKYSPKIDLVFEAQEREIYEMEKKARLDDLEELRTATEKGRMEGIAESLRRMLEHGIPEEEARRILGLA